MRSKGSNQAVVVIVPGNDGEELAPGTLDVVPKKAGLK